MFVIGGAAVVPESELIVVAKRGGRSWRKLRAQVLREEPICRIRIEGVCTIVSDCVDHIIPYKIAPHLELVRTNLRGACSPCNMRRGARMTAEPIKRADALSFFD